MSAPENMWWRERMGDTLLVYFLQAPHMHGIAAINAYVARGRITETTQRLRLRDLMNGIDSKETLEGLMSG